MGHQRKQKRVCKCVLKTSKNETCALVNKISLRTTQYRALREINAVYYTPLTRCRRLNNSNVTCKSESTAQPSMHMYRKDARCAVNAMYRLQMGMSTSSLEFGTGPVAPRLARHANGYQWGLGEGHTNRKAPTSMGNGAALCVRELQKPRASRGRARLHVRHRCTPRREVIASSESVIAYFAAGVLGFTQDRQCVALLFFIVFNN